MGHDKGQIAGTTILRFVQNILYPIGMDNPGIQPIAKTRRHANENPWYCLATLHGELEDNSPSREEVIARSRTAWNRWYAGEWTAKSFDYALVNGRIPHEERQPFGHEEKENIIRLFSQRVKQSCGLSLEIPAPCDPVDFSATIFQNDISFLGFLFANPVSFDGAVFDIPALFGGAIFLDRADFLEVSFNRSANFKSTYHSAVCNFKKAVFSESANFVSAKYHGGVIYVESQFKNEVWFDRCEIKCFADYGSAAFIKRARFTDTKFYVFSSFESAIFREVVSFNSVEFYYDVNFSKALFEGEVEFSENVDNKTPIFRGNADFTSVIFSRRASFSTSTFLKEAVFYGARFESDAFFENSKFKAMARLNDVFFARQASFINAEFLYTTSFESSRFYREVPDFSGCKLHEGTSWYNVRWPVAPTTREQALRQIKAYECLKQDMADKKNHEEEQLLFRKELRARRETYALLSFDRLANSLYDLLSGYGESIYFPIYWMVMTVLWGALFFAWADGATVVEMSSVDAILFSSSSLFSLFPIQKYVVSECVFEKVSFFGKLVYVGASIVNAVLLFLLGLALRNRFRMK